MIHFTPELQRLVLESDRLSGEIQLLRSKKRITVADLRQLAGLKAELLQMCPPARFVWLDGLPVADILKTLSNIEKEI